MRGVRLQLVLVTAAALLLLLFSSLAFPNGRLGQTIEIDTNYIHGHQNTQELEKQLLVNVNTADLVKLQRIVGGGPVLAQAILDHRQQYGSFADLEDLLDVKGIGRAKLEQMRPYCYAG